MMKSQYKTATKFSTTILVLAYAVLALLTYSLGATPTMAVLWAILITLTVSEVVSHIFVRKFLAR